MNTPTQAAPQFESPLRDSELQFRQLVAGVTDYAIYMLDSNGVIISWNTGAERIKGYKRAEIVGKHFSHFYTPQDRAAGLPQQALATAVRTGKYEAEAWRLRKDGVRFWASVIIDAIYGDDGKLIGFAKITRDMTERRALQEQLNQLQKMEAIGQLTGGIAHDFNNLLTVILGNLETIVASLSPDNPRIQRAAEHATLGAQRAATLTQQLLAFARRQPLNPRAADPNQLIAGMLDMLSRTLGETILIDSRLRAGIWRIEVDTNQLEQTLLNLVVNARDAMPAGGTLTIRTSHSSDFAGDLHAPPGEHVVICIADSGAGMSEEVVGRAFEPFFTTKPIGKGTGLGLSQVYGFVTQSGGEVAIESAPGKGTTIKIYLPRLVGEVCDTSAPPPIDSVPGGRETILVVEDDAGVRSFSVETLRELGYTVLEANDARQALQVLAAHPEVQLLFTDVGLPGATGRDLAESAHPVQPGLRVLYTSGYPHHAIVHRGRLDPGVALLTKPFTRSQLALRIRTMLDGKSETK